MTDKQAKELFKKFLKQKGIYNKFKTNLLLQKLTNIDDYLSTTSNPYTYIFKAFDFNHTTEGKDYWHKIDEEWNSLLGKQDFNK